MYANRIVRLSLGALALLALPLLAAREDDADRVSKNTLTAGGGIEFYIRDDVALRGEVRGATVLGQQFGSDGTVAYGYREFTIGFSFYRSLGG